MEALHKKARRYFIISVAMILIITLSALFNITYYSNTPSLLMMLAAAMIVITTTIITFTNTMTKVVEKLAKVLDWTWFCLTTIAAVLLITLTVIVQASVVGNSMNPTLKDNDRFALYHFLYQPEVDDIVVVDVNKEHLVKRLVAAANDVIGFQLIDGSDAYLLLINNQIHQNQYEQYYIVTQRQKHALVGDGNEVRLEAGYYFVLGDNANNSVDSRDTRVGIIRRYQIIGKKLF